MNIAIVGAGLLGRLLAWRLLSTGHSVSLTESGSLENPHSAAYTAAAMISPLSEVVVSDRLIFDMGLSSLSLWPRWIETLNRETPNLPSVSYSAQGSIAVAHQLDHSELAQFKNEIAAKLKHDDTSSWLNKLEISELEPALAHFHHALFLPGEAHLDNRQLLSSLLVAIRQLGGKCTENNSVDLNNGDDQKQFNDADWILDCRGMGAKTTSNQLRGVRGEVMWVEGKDVELSRPVRLMHPRYKLYIVPKPNNQFIIGATEIESEDSSPISLQSNLELASALYTINPAFSEARVIETDTNLRPTFRDNLPKVQRLHPYGNGAKNNILQINGLYRHGYLLAPTIVEHISNWIEEKQPGNFWSAIYHDHETAYHEVTHREKSHRNTSHQTNLTTSNIK
ncbi:glycine oxidase ThiO [Aurantivibrio infirmus]